MSVQPVLMIATDATLSAGAVRRVRTKPFNIFKEKTMKIRRMAIAALLVLIAVFALGWKTWKNMAYKEQQQYDGMQLIVNDLPQHGVIIHDASRPAFKSELSASYKIPPELLDDMMRYSV